MRHVQSRAKGLGSGFEALLRDDIACNSRSRASNQRIQVVKLSSCQVVVAAASGVAGRHIKPKLVVSLAVLGAFAAGALAFTAAAAAAAAAATSEKKGLAPAHPRAACHVTVLAEPRGAWSLEGRLESGLASFGRAREEPPGWLRSKTGETRFEPLKKRVAPVAPPASRRLTLQKT